MYIILVCYFKKYDCLLKLLFKKIYYLTRREKEYILYNTESLASLYFFHFNVYILNLYLYIKDTPLSVSYSFPNTLQLNVTNTRMLQSSQHLY